MDVVGAVLGLMIFGKSHGLVVATAGGLDVVEEAIRVGEPLPDIGVGEKAPVLGMLCQFDGLPGTILRQSRAAARFCTVADFVFHAGVLAHALEKSSTRHQDIV